MKCLHHLCSRIFEVVAQCIQKLRGIFLVLVGEHEDAPGPIKPDDFVIQVINRSAPNAHVRTEINVPSNYSSPVTSSVSSPATESTSIPASRPISNRAPRPTPSVASSSSLNPSASRVDSVLESIEVIKPFDPVQHFFDHWTSPCNDNEDDIEPYPIEESVNSGINPCGQAVPMIFDRDYIFPAISNPNLYWSLCREAAMKKKKEEEANSNQKYPQRLANVKINYTSGKPRMIVTMYPKPSRSEKMPPLREEEEDGVEEEDENSDTTVVKKLERTKLRFDGLVEEVEKKKSFTWFTLCFSNKKREAFELY